MKRSIHEMGTDSSANFSDCPKAKKSKSSTEFESYWHCLPSLVLHEIFDLLGDEDRKNASLVCKNWRQNIFHPKWWPQITFKIEQSNLKKAKFYTRTFGKIITSATIKINSLCMKCIEELIVLLEALSDNNNLKELILEPSHCRLELPSEGQDLRKILDLLRDCLPKLSKFSIGCIEDLSYALEDIVMNLSPAKVTHLGLASVKDDLGRYRVSGFDPALIIPFSSLKVFSLDYDQLNDELLQNLKVAEGLKRLVVHLHGVREDHPGTTEQAWVKFYQVHPECELRLSVIHAFNDIKKLHEKVLKKNMRLSHFKVFFCENVNLGVLEYLVNQAADSIRSIVWVDSLGDNERNWLLANKMYIDMPDPLLLIAWQCKNLEELILYGYKYREENLVAIGRLRGPGLKVLEIAEDDIIMCPAQHAREGKTLEDIPKCLKKPWAPKRHSELHPVICNPTAGDSDEYLLPIVLADLH